MKNLIITSLSVLALAMAFTGCGDSGSVSSSASNSTGTGTENSVGVESSTVDVVPTETTTPKTPFNLSDKLGTPPGLPSN